MSEPIRLSPVFLDGSLAYLVTGPAEELEQFTESLPGPLDHDLHKSVRGTSASCHVWRGFLWVSDEEMREHLEAAILGSGCDAVVMPGPVVSAIPCGCGNHCAAGDSVCWGCLNATPTETVEGHAYCPDCAKALRESIGTSDTLPPPAPVDEGAEAAHAALVSAVLG